MQDALLQDLLLFAQPASGRHRFGHVKAVGQVAIELGAKIQGQHEQGMGEQKATQLRTGGEAFLDFEQEGFDIRTLGMGSLARPRGVDGGFRNHTPVKEGKEGTVALHNGIMFHEQGMVRWSNVVEFGIIMTDSLQGMKDTLFSYYACKLFLLSSPAVITSRLAC